MGRWEPNARGRLEQAALALYGERGFDQVTVAEIAGRAGLTERTFFRHYADKREVLFAGWRVLREALMGAVAEAPDDSSPMDAVMAALRAIAPVFEERRDLVRQRQAIIDSTPMLQERELVKMATLATALTEALHERGVTEPAASLTGQTGVAILQVAFQHWVNATDRRLPDLLQDSFDQLRTLTAGAGPAAPAATDH